VGFPVCYGSPSDVFAVRRGFVHLYALRFKEKEKRAAVVADATVHKNGSVQRFKFDDRLEFSVGQWVIHKNFTRMSLSEFEVLINLIGEKSRKRTQRSGRPFLFKKGWH
jgi:hypothetical protein